MRDSVEIPAAVERPLNSNHQEEETTEDTSLDPETNMSPGHFSPPQSSSSADLNNQNSAEHVHKNLTSDVGSNLLRSSDPASMNGYSQDDALIPYHSASSLSSSNCNSTPELTSESHTPLPNNSNSSKSEFLDVPRLRDQLNLMSQRLLNAQDQIDKLLEEKQVWLQSAAQVSHRSNAGELRARWLQATTLAETYKREKENMVVKYAQTEQKCIRLEERIKELMASKSQLNSKASSEQPNDTANNPLGETVNEDINVWQQRCNQLEKTLAATREQMESLKKSNVLTESKLSALEKRLNQTQETLRAEQQKVAAQNISIVRLNRSLEAAQKEAKGAERLREREAERLCMEVAYRETQEKLHLLSADHERLKKQLSEMDLLRSEIEENHARLTELTDANSVIPELQTELESLREREENLSDLTRRLTEQNVKLQADHLASTSRLQEIEERLHMQEQSILEKTSEAERLIAAERSRSLELESQLQVSLEEVDQLRKRESKLSKDLQHEREQASLVHTRDAARIRDLKRQLSRMPHTPAPQPLVITDGSAVTGLSKTLSGSGSLHSVELGATSPDVSPKPRTAYPVGDSLLITGEYNCHGASADQSQISLADPFEESERAAWLAKIDRLQKMQLRLSDKVEFYEDHCSRLTEELSQKTRIIQSLLTSDRQIGSASPQRVDMNRELLSQTGGFMASVFTGKQSQEPPDLDTSLEISRKLQLVLEDALFKNITYKDNLQTLGSEVSRLTQLIDTIRSNLCTACHDRTEPFH